jgi:hypothetical protein
LVSYFEMPIRREMYSRSLGRLPPSMLGDQVVLEVDGDAAGGQLAVAAREVERVVPAVGVEGVGQQRGAEDELDLVAALADLQLAQHLLRHEVALLDVRTVGREHPQEFLQLGDGGRLRARVRGCRGLVGIGGDRAGAVLTGAAGLVWLRQDAQPETAMAVTARPATSAARAWERWKKNGIHDAHI